VEKPMVFEGKKTELQDFISQLRVYFRAQPTKFRNDTARCLAATQFLRGTAYKYFQPMLNEEPLPACLTNFESFIAQLQQTFGDPNETRTAARQLSTLRQIASVANYITEFRRLSTILDWDNKVLQHFFYTGLSDEIKDELARVEPPDTLDQLVQLALRIDHRLYERRLERRLPRPPPRVLPPPPRMPPPPSPAPLPAGPTPMEIDGGRPVYRRLTPEENQRRRALNLCLYCGQPGHKALTCPSRPPQPARAYAIDVNPYPVEDTTIAPTPSAIMIPPPPTHAPAPGNSPTQ
jgi:hypothetical protein